MVYNRLKKYDILRKKSVTNGYQTAKSILFRRRRIRGFFQKSSRSGAPVFIPNGLSVCVQHNSRMEVSPESFRRQDGAQDSDRRGMARLLNCRTAYGAVHRRNIRCENAPPFARQNASFMENPAKQRAESSTGLPQKTNEYGKDK